MLYQTPTFHQVHGFYRDCGGPVCNCAAAIKSGDDVIVFDRCGAMRDADHAKKDKVIEKTVYLNGDLTAGTVVRDLGKKVRHQYRPPKCLRHSLGETPLPMLVLVQNKPTWSTVNQ